MIEWLASGIPAAVEASGPRFLPTLLQLLTFIGIAFGAGLFFGRFWLTRIIQTKEAELASEVRRYEAQSERLSFYSDQITKFKEDIENAQNLDEAKEVAKEIPPVSGVQFNVQNRAVQEVYRNYLKDIKEQNHLTNKMLSEETGVNRFLLIDFLNNNGILSGASMKKVREYVSDKMNR